MRKSTDTYEHTVNGLLQRRKEIMEEMVVMRERLGALANDVEAIDRVLQTLGHDEKLEMVQASPRLIVFYRGQIRQWLLTQLREHGPATTRQLAERLVQMQERDVKDRRLMSEVIARVARGLHNAQTARLIIKTQTTKRGENTWRLNDGG